MSRADRLEAAKRYLNLNQDLRDALGINVGVKLPICFLGSGEHNENFVFVDPGSGTKYVLRINMVPQPFHKNQIAYEHAALKALEPSMRTPAPLYMDCSKTLLEQNAMVISFCPGRELDFDDLREKDLERSLKIMADIHSIEAPGMSPLHRPRNPFDELFGECMDRYRLYLNSGFADERITAWAERFISAVRPHLDKDVRSGLLVRVVNTETLPSHFLLSDSADVDRNPGFFIDWERPIIGDVAQDIAYFTSPTTTFWDSEYLMPKRKSLDCVEQYWKAVAGRFAREDFDERFEAWRMLTVLRSTMWCCKAYALQQAGEGSFMTGKAASKLPIYLSDDFMERIYDDCF